MNLPARRSRRDWLKQVCGTAAVVGAGAGVWPERRGAFAEAQEPTLDLVKPIRILWAGSSSTYFHDMPRQVARLVSSRIRKRPRAAVFSKLVGRSGDGIHVYLRPGFHHYEYGVKPGKTFLDVVREGRYDYVVLQAFCKFVVGPQGDEHDRAFDVYCKEVRDSGAIPVIYEMGWERGDLGDAARARIFSIAVRNKVTEFVPCSTAWRRLRMERPDLELQNPEDLLHPGVLGNYLNIACFVSEFTGLPPVGMPTAFPVWGKLSESERETIKESTDRARLDPYTAALPMWMRMHSLGARKVSIDDDSARYLRLVAWQEWSNMRRRLRESIEPRRARLDSPPSTAPSTSSASPAYSKPPL